MIKSQLAIFMLRWLVSTCGMWLCIKLFATVTAPDDFWLYATAGLVFSLINSIVKPLTKMLALPLIILSMGIFSLIINVAMVELAIWILPDVSMGFWGSIWSALILSLINSLVNLLVPSYNSK